jgi:hypothetical protein
MDFWEGPSIPDADSRLTTIFSWKHTGRDVRWDGETWHWSKDREFRRFLTLPSVSALPLEICVGGISDAERQEVARYGWSVKNAVDYREPDDYRNYILRSLGEFSAEKEQVVVSRSGWFSDRSVCYLAAGRPVIVQNTAFSNFLPTGAGLFGFSTLDEAATAIEAVSSNYEKHSRAARDLAREYFDADRVVRNVLETVGVI